MKPFLRRRLLDPLRAQLTRGVTPARLALSLALGAGLGVLPVLGTTTIVCGVAAAALRLNQPAVQAANYLVYPLQLALYLPFLRLGAHLFGGGPISMSMAQLRAGLAADLTGTLGRYAAANLRAVAAWALVVPLAVALLQLLLRPVLARSPLGRIAAPAGRVPSPVPAVSPASPA